MSRAEGHGPDAVADAAPGNWVDTLAPAPARAYLRLARVDRPIGVWLLLWPCWWSTALAGLSAGQAAPNLWHLGLFAVGALVMRAAGCTYNDLIDRDFDRRVERTRNRPIASGKVRPWQALVFMVALSLVGLLVLLQFNRFTIVLGVSSLGVVALYPFMKRVTYWPQSVLGLAFAWGALMGWAATFGQLDWPALALYAATVSWTVGYDTIYAHQDKDDDALLGLKSTALRFGPQSRQWLMLFYGLTTACLIAAGIGAGAGLIYFVGVAAGALHLAWQIATLDIEDPDNCLRRFRSNRDFGAIIFVALLLEMVAAAYL